MHTRNAFGLVVLLFVLAACATGGPSGGRLVLEDEGSFFVNGQSYRSEHPGASLNTGAAPPGNITIKQMYVQYRVPAEKSGPAIVMVHGSQHTGKTYETTPDGREGWATWFVRRGHPVYVVDQAGRSEERRVGKEGRCRWWPEH